jgi:hypothetical protein
MKGGFLSQDELAVVHAACALLPAFEGVRLVAHTLYTPARWCVEWRTLISAPLPMENRRSNT